MKVIQIALEQDDEIGASLYVLTDSGRIFYQVPYKVDPMGKWHEVRPPQIQVTKE